MGDRLRGIVLIIFTVVWALNITVPIFVKDYEIIPELNAAFMGVVGIIVAGRKNNNTESAPEEAPVTESQNQRPPE